MSPSRRLLTLSLVASLLAVPALARQPPDAPMPGMAAAKPAAAGSAAADRAMMNGMDKMNAGMNAAAMTGDPDRDFVAMMIPHHQGAIDMAKVELRYGKDPVMLRLSHQIVAAQAREIALMQRWQMQHRPAQ